MVQIEERGKSESRNAAGVRSFVNSFLSSTKAALNKARENVAGLASAEAKAERYVKQCWNHMVRNDVDAAKQAYDELVQAYEAMDDGEAKEQMYYEVRDIYKRISDF